MLPLMEDLHEMSSFSTYQKDAEEDRCSLFWPLHSIPAFPNQLLLDTPHALEKESSMHSMSLAERDRKNYGIISKCFDLRVWM